MSGCVAGDFAKLGHSQFLILPEKGTCSNGRRHTVRGTPLYIVATQRRLFMHHKTSLVT